MLNQTTITAIQSLIYITLSGGQKPISPAEIAGHLDASQAYLSKINTDLVKAHILRAHRGAKGGVMLARPPAQVTLLDVVEACQGRILGDYCQPHDDTSAVCAFHVAMQALQDAVLNTLGAWTIQDLAEKPMPVKHLRGKVLCRTACACPNPKRKRHP